MTPLFKRLPQHIGVIPDGNRRWAVERGLPKEAGYNAGIEPGFRLYEKCLELGVKELTLYGFTQDNNKRPAIQRKSFQKACIDAVRMIADRDAALLVLGNAESPMFPEELKPLTKRHKFGNGSIKVNFLVNYGWNWDLSRVLLNNQGKLPKTPQAFMKSLASADVSRIDLIIRWGGRRRLSGLLPAQSVYADFYVDDTLWPDFEMDQFYNALSWYEQQDITLGG